jgi:PAS domain S-box-containing protein
MVVLGMVGLAFLCLWGAQAGPAVGASSSDRALPTDPLSLYDAISAGVIVRRSDGSIAYVNRSATAMFGLTPAEFTEDLEGRTLRFFDEDGKPIPTENWPSRRALRTGTPVTKELVGVLASGRSLLWAMVDVTLIESDQAGGDTLAVVTFTDVTERKQASDAVQKTEQKLRSMLRAAPVGFGVLHERRILWVNENFCRLFGRCEDDLLGCNIRLLYEDESEYRRVGETVYVQMLENGVGYTQSRFRRADGRGFDGHVQVAPLVAGNPRGKVAVAIVDITEQKNAERELRESNTSLQRKNIALEEMTSQIRHERREFADRIASEADRLLLPLVSRLERSLDQRDRQYLQALVDDFRAVLQPYRRATTGRMASLTPTEMRIATLIRRGLTAKEIAHAESLSPATVNTHRANIRKKLNLRGRQVNLATHLRSLFDSSSV